MDENRLAFYALTLVPNLGPKRCMAISHAFDDMPAIWSTPTKALKRTGLFPGAILDHMKSAPFIEMARKRMEDIEHKGGHLMLYIDDDYPSRLRHIPSPPVVLYVSGDPSILLSERAVGIVGTRRPTAYGAERVRELVEGLSKWNIHVISGLAFGIDAIAHRAALDHGLRTTAVLGGAIDRIYPAEHRTLAKEITGYGSLLSEYYLGVQAEREHFPMRNRIIAGLSDIVVVGESRERGGSMITAWMANDFNREVATFPGDVGRPNARGGHLLIKTNQAHLIESAEDVIDLMRWGQKSNPDPQMTLFDHLDENEEKLVRLLQKVPKLHLDQASIELNVSVSALSHIVFQLEMKGVVRSMAGSQLTLTGGN